MSYIALAQQHSQKKNGNPVPAFFRATLRKILKILKNTRKVIFFEQFGKVTKYSDKFGKIHVRPEKSPHLILVKKQENYSKLGKILQKSGKMLLGRIPASTSFWLLKIHISNVSRLAIHISLWNILVIYRDWLHSLGRWISKVLSTSAEAVWPHIIQSSTKSCHCTHLQAWPMHDKPAFRALGRSKASDFLLRTRRGQRRRRNCVF